MLEKICISIVKNPYNFSFYQIIKIVLIIYCTYIVPRDQDKFIFYISNYINWDQFDYLYDPEQIEKDIRNINIVVCKLKLVSIKATNQRSKFANKKRRKRREIIERWKTKLLLQNTKELKEKLVCLMKRREIMLMTPKMKQI